MKKNQLGPQSKQSETMARKNSPAGRNLEPIQTLEGRHLLMANWGDKEIDKNEERKGERERARVADRPE